MSFGDAVPNSGVLPAQTFFEMATSKKGNLTTRHITRLAANISLQDMKGIAQGYLDIDKKTIAKLLEENENDLQAFNRDILEKWAENNQGGDQVQVSITRLLPINA